MEYVSLEEVYEAYFQCRKNKRTKNSSLAFEMHYETKLRELWNDLNNMSYSISSSIVFGVTRPKCREVFAANFRDRIVHHLLMIKLEPLLEEEMIDNSYNCRNGKGTEYGIQTLSNQIKKVSENYTKETYVLQCDIQGFFMSIDKDVLWKAIKDVMERKWNYGNLEWWMWLVKMIIYHRPELNCTIHGDKSILDSLPDNKTLFRSNGKGLPIGNLTSQIFGNFYLTCFDRYVIELFGKECEYGRYVDDFYIISANKKCLLKSVPNIRRYLYNDLKSNLHPKKISIIEVKKGIKFIGSVVKPWGIYIGNRTVNNAFSVAIIKKPKDMKRYVQRLNSYFGYMVHRLSYGIRYKLWNAIYNKNNLYSVNMKKIKYKNKRRYYDKN